MSNKTNHGQSVRTGQSELANSHHESDNAANDPGSCQNWLSHYCHSSRGKTQKITNKR